MEGDSVLINIDCGGGKLIMVSMASGMFDMWVWEGVGEGKGRECQRNVT